MHAYFVKICFDVLRFTMCYVNECYCFGYIIRLDKKPKELKSLRSLTAEWLLPKWWHHLKYCCKHSVENSFWGIPHPVRPPRHKTNYFDAFASPQFKNYYLPKRFTLTKKTSAAFRKINKSCSNLTICKVLRYWNGVTSGSK